MKFEKIHNKGQAKLFKNQYLEYLTKTNPVVIWSIYMPVIIFMLYYCNAAAGMDLVAIAAVFFSGMFFWTLFEYLIHRFAFHFIAESKRAMKIVYIIHGNHHEYPRDKERLFMPPVPSLILASFIFGGMYFIALLTGLKENAFAFFPGFMLGYLMYGTMHYAIHAFNPPYKWMKPLWRNHHLHHYKNEHRGFGVSTTLWDRVFGTMFDLTKEKEDKEKVKDLTFVIHPKKKETVA
jgi:sterol desaturase/sphingolipid hydroxylase (fatty acid hydroxylase superfamily)